MKTIFHSPSRSGVIAAVLLTVLSACASGSYDPRRTDEFPVARSAENFAADSSLATLLDRADVAALAIAFIDAMEATPGSTPKRWTGEGANGEIVAGAVLLGNVLADPSELLDIKDGIVVDWPLETDQGPYVLVKNSNIRMGPSTDYGVLETLPAGTGVEGIGKVVDDDWMLIARDDRAIGYVFVPLLEKAPGAELLTLAGGPTRQPFLCREFEQNLDVNGQKDRWRGLACNFKDGWGLVGGGGPTVLGTMDLGTGEATIGDHGAS